MNKNEILKAIEEKEREINELKEQLKVNTGWGINKNNIYYYFGTSGQVNYHEFINDNADLAYKETVNMFSTEEKAEEIVFKQLLFRKLQKFADENNKCEIDWNDYNQGKWGIKYNYYGENIETTCFYGSVSFGEVYFSERETALHAIDEFKSELKKYFGVEEN